MEYKQLIITDEAKLSLDEKRFVVLHKDIVFCGNSAVEYAVKMATDLKEMRDSKAYKVAGFESFGSYTENALGIKERQAYNYISVLEKLPADFLHSNAKLGITKLLLLSGLDESDRDSVVAVSNIEDITVKELKVKIAELENRNKQLQMDLDSEVDKMGEQVLAVNKELEDKINEINELKKQSGEVVVLRKKLNQAESNLKSAQTAASGYEKELKELKNMPPKTITVQDTETVKALEASKARENELNSEIEVLKKKLMVASDTAMSKFKVKFEDLQRLGAEIVALIGSLDEEKAHKCRKAVKSVIEGWKL